MGGDSTVFALPRAIYQLTLMGRTSEARACRRTLTIESSAEAKALGRAKWLEEALPECELDELCSRMRRATAEQLLARPSGSLLVVVEAGEFEFVADGGLSGRVRETSLSASRPPVCVPCAWVGTSLES